MGSWQGETERGTGQPRGLPPRQLAASGRDAAMAEPIETFPSLGEALYDIGLVLAAVLGVALAASAALLT